MLPEVIMCAWLVSGYPVGIDKEIALLTCGEIAVRATEVKEDPALLIALAYHESRLNPNAISKSKARGPLQVMPKQCKRWRRAGSPLKKADSPTVWRKCDLIAAGIWTWMRWRTKSKSERQAVCRYNAGYRCKKNTKSWRWAGAVVSLAKKLRSIDYKIEVVK